MLNKHGKVELVPSLLACNNARLEEGLRLVENCKLKTVHIDVMDGHFVPNLSFGPKLVKDLRHVSRLKFDVHLMLERPAFFVESFAEAGADEITFHVESSVDVGDCIDKVRELGCRVGIALNPDTQIDAISPYLEMVDIILIMSVNPGFCGQKFLPKVLNKVGQLLDLREKYGYNYIISMDGGINKTNIVEFRHRGVDRIVMGSAFFNG